MSKITGFSIAKDGVECAFKSPAIVIHIEPNIFSPIVYFRKPAYLSDDQFKAVVADILSQIKGLSEETIAILEDAHLIKEGLIDVGEK